MSKAKTVTVRKHKRSTPSKPKHEGPGNKLGPKNVPVKKHKRSTP
jgi:hypothetical protein